MELPDIFILEYSKLPRTGIWKFVLHALFELTVFLEEYIKIRPLVMFSYVIF